MVCGSKIRGFLAVLLMGSLCRSVVADDPRPFPGTKPLQLEGDITSQLVEGADRFLLGQLEQSIARRPRFWKRDVSSPTAYEKSIEPNRKELARILGVVERRVRFEAPELIATTKQPAVIGRAKSYDAYAVRWPVFGGIHGEGILLEPKLKEPLADVVAIPDADQTPEQLCGLMPGIPAESQFARRLAESGCRVLVPALVSREVHRHNGRVDLTNREFVYRTSFEMGRNIIGYELQKILAGLDWLIKEAPGRYTGVFGYGEGGLLALYASALESRIDAVAVSGYFGSRQDVWREPIDRNVFGLLKQFGDAEILSLVAPRAVIIEACRSPEVTLSTDRGAPGRLVTPSPKAVQAEFERGLKLVEGLAWKTKRLIQSPTDQTAVGAGFGPFSDQETLRAFLYALSASAELKPAGELPELLAKNFNHSPFARRRMIQRNRGSQPGILLRDSADVRRQFMNKLDTSSVRGF